MILISYYQAGLQGSNRLQEGGSGHAGPTPPAPLLCPVLSARNKSPQIDLNLRPRIKHKAQNDWLHNSSSSGQYLVETPFGSSCRLGSVWTGPSQFTCLGTSPCLNSSHRFWIWLRSDLATSGQLLSCFETVTVWICLFFSFLLRGAFEHSQRWFLWMFVPVNWSFLTKVVHRLLLRCFPTAWCCHFYFVVESVLLLARFPEKVRVPVDEELVGTVQTSPSSGNRL